MFQKQKVRAGARMMKGPISMLRSVEFVLKAIESHYRVEGQGMAWPAL